MHVSQGVQGLHAKGRAHCDLKPQNIMAQLSPEGKVLSCVVHDLEGSIVHDGAKMVYKYGQVAFGFSTILMTIVSITAIDNVCFQQQYGQEPASSLYNKQHAC